MMEVYRTPSKEIQEIILASVTYEAVIKGLNGYFASEPRNNYITVKMESDKQNFALYEGEAWADILIEWLRKKHEIFYYPGMEAKKEDVWKNVMNCIRQEASPCGFGLPRACQDLIEDLKRRDEEIKELKERIAKLEERIAKLEFRVEAVCNEYDIFRARALNTECVKRALGEESDILHKSVDSVNKECKATGKLMVEDYKLKLKDYILKDIKKHGYRYGGLQSKSVEEIVDWIITMATSDRSNIALRDIYTTVASPAERLRYNIDDCNGEIVDHMKEYILRRFEGLRINTEYCLRKMSELDGCQKDLKILEEQQEFLVKQNSELTTKVSAKDDENSRLKGLINAMNKEVGDM